MKNRFLWVSASCLVLLAACAKDDLSWKEEMKELQKTPFSFVLAQPPADTVSKGLDFTSTIRINPSGLAFTKDMLALDYLSGKQFYREESDAAKSSYIKKSEYFSLKAFEADKNDGGETLDGQYLVTLTTAAQEAVWDDSRLAFVGTYIDKEGKDQLVSSVPFNTVMMPLPAEGLNPWLYPHASFLIPEKKKDKAGNEYMEERFGAVYLPLDGVVFKTRDNSDGRYYTPENLDAVSFVPDEDCEAGIKLEYDLKKRFVSFVPDTTGNPAWRAFKDSTGVKRQEVKGFVVLKDRWGGASSYHVTMYWYNTYVIPLQVSATVEEIKAGIPMNLMEEVRKLGLDYEVLKDCRRVSPFHVHHLFNDLVYEPLDDLNQEVGELTLYADPVPGEQYRTEEIRSVSVYPSEVDPLFGPLTVSFKLAITLTVK